MLAELTSRESLGFFFHVGALIGGGGGLIRTPASPPGSSGLSQVGGGADWDPDQPPPTTEKRSGSGVGGTLGAPAGAHGIRQHRGVRGEARVALTRQELTAPWASKPQKFEPKLFKL